MRHDISIASQQKENLSFRVAATNKDNALWLLEKLVPGSGINNIGLALQVDGRLQADALRASLAIMLGQYQVLRTVFFATDAELAKKDVPEDEFNLEIEEIELSGERFDDDLNAFVAKPFCLDGRPLVRAGFATRPDGDAFCVVVHHLIFDANSIIFFIRAFVPVYNAVAAGRPVPSEVFTEMSFREPEPQAADLAYWRESLNGFVPDGLDLWCGSPRVQRPLMSGKTVSHALSDEALRAVVRLQRETRAPVAAVMLAAYYALLASHGAGPDLVISSPLNIRTPQSLFAIGDHVNVAPLRLRVDFTEGFRQLARRARAVFLGAMAHSSVSVDDLSAEFPRTSSSWQTTLSRHLFNYLPVEDSDGLIIDGMTARVLPVENGFSKFDIELIVMPSKTAIRIPVRYCTEILARADVEALLRRYEAILTAAAQDPDRPVGELAGWSELDRKVIDTANETTRPVECATVLAAFRSRVLTSPEASAIIDDERILTYRQVWEAACAIRDLLNRSGISAGDTVALIVPRNHEIVLGAFGVWLAGAAYLPLDAAQDISWLARQLTLSGAKAVLTGSGVRPLSGEGLPPQLPLGTAPGGSAEDAAIADAHGPACQTYACGRAGQPVATVLGHQGIASLVTHFAGELAAGPATCTLALADFSSFGSFLELFLPLSSGGHVVIAPDKVRADEDALADLIERHGVRIVQVPPGRSARLLEAAAGRQSGLRIIVRREDLSSATARRLLAAGCELHGVCGDAETTGWAMSGRLDGEVGMTRGRPITNTRAFVVAPDGRELPIGVRGQLCIAGSGVALGPEDEYRFARSERYGRHYRTGELACWRPDGTIERLGQISRQAIIAGSRVNLDEVAAALLDQGVSAAAAFTVKSPAKFPADGEVLVGFAEVSGGAEPADWVGDWLRQRVSVSLDSAAVPECVICLSALPRRPDGHVDHDALELLAVERLNAQRQSPGADDPLVQKLMELWRQLLKTDVTAQTVFFAAGGHSLLAVKLAQGVEELTGERLELSEIFVNPTPSALAARLSAIKADAASRRDPGLPRSADRASAGTEALTASTIRIGPSAFASWGSALTCYTGALGVYLAFDDDRWWRLLADDAPYLGILPAPEGLLRFEHHSRPPVGLIGLRAHGADGWDAAWDGIRSELDAAGRVVIAADAGNVPWLRTYGRKHAPHWFVLARDEEGYVVDDPLELIDDHGQQSPVRVHLEEDDIRRCSGALVDPPPHLVLREEATLGSSASALGRAYRWLVRGDPSPDEPAPVARHGALDLAERFERAAADPVSYVQVDDIWQALRQRELLIRVLRIEEELGELRGLPARQPWERVTELWRQVPTLLMHAQLLARTGGQGIGANALARTLRDIAEAENQLAANRFPPVAS